MHRIWLMGCRAYRYLVNLLCIEFGPSKQNIVWFRLWLSWARHKRQPQLYFNQHCLCKNDDTPWHEHHELCMFCTCIPPFYPNCSLTRVQPRDPISVSKQETHNHTYLNTSLTNILISPAMTPIGMGKIISNQVLLSPHYPTPNCHQLTICPAEISFFPFFPPMYSPFLVPGANMWYDKCPVQLQ